MTFLKRHVTRTQSEIHNGVNIHSGLVFFWDKRTFHLVLQTEHFHPRLKYII